MGKFMDYIRERVVPEIEDMLVQKTAQGSAEIAQALNSQANAFVPYGAAQQPLEIEGPATSYQAHLRDASHSGERELDRGMDR